MPASHRVGSILFMTEPLKLALITETKDWMLVFAKSLNDKCGREMSDLLASIETNQKKLSRPVKDLDDIRSHMAVLTEIRESEIKIDLTIMPIEETYVMLNKYELVFNDGNAEHVDTLGYNWKLLKQQVERILARLDFKLFYPIFDSWIFLKFSD